MYRASARKRARLDAMIHGIPTSSVAPRGAPDDGEDSGVEVAVSDPEVDRETGSGGPL